MYSAAREQREALGNTSVRVILVEFGSLCPQLHGGQVTSPSESRAWSSAHTGSPSSWSRLKASFSSGETAGHGWGQAEGEDPRETLHL